MDTRFEDIISEIKQAVEKYPTHVAIVEDAVTTMTYQELWNHSLCFAEGLHHKCNDSEYVILELPKSTQYIVALLGCWMIGKAFIPLGSDLPEFRKEYIKSQVKNFAHVTLDTYPSFLSQNPLELTSALRPDTPAYMIFSSGTTGNPKGIIVGHSGLVNLARCQREAFGLCGQSRNIFFLSINFDASISDILTTITSGAALVIESEDSVSLSANLMKIVHERQITHADLPPSLLRVMDAGNCPKSLETIVIGGEATDKETVKAWGTKVRLVNVYGPTEATVCTSLCQYSEDWDVPVVGKELDGVQYHIFNNGDFDAQEGELWISGACLAIGYYNNPELTNKKFPVIDGVRYYRTSDHVRRLPNGDIAFLGRYDRQVKFHGQLVELEEVEECLKKLRLVKNVAVVKRQISEQNQKEMLVAFVEVEDTSLLEDSKAIITKFLRHHLPAWMIPGHIEILDSIPRVTSGKVDFKSLELMSIDLAKSLEEEPYSSEKEELIAGLMAEILKMPRINPHDNFIELGADSLDTLLLIARLHSQYGITITLDNLKSDATPSAISRIDNTEKSMAMTSEQLKSQWNIALPSFLSTAHSANPIVLVTGATGFLGSHILVEILNRQEYAKMQIACLVRCDSSEHGEQRLRSTLSQYGLSCRHFERLMIIPSDLSKTKMGLNNETYKYLANNVSEVFHCAATVNMMADYGSLKESNVTATKHIAEFCLTGCKKHLNYASTLSVFVSTSRNEGIAYENDCLDNNCMIYGGYGQTKFVCEKMLLSIPVSMCDINIIRYGLLCGDTISGVSAKKDFLGMFLRGAVALGVLPWDNTGQMGIDITPIDIATSITLDIATRSTNGVYHVASENPLKYNHLCELLSDNSGVRIVPDYSDWQKELVPHRQNPDITALEMSLCRMDANAYESMRYMDLFQTTNIKFDMQNTHKVTTLRISQNDLLISKYIHHETI